MNKKQTNGQDLCECGHKEFHHRRTFEGNLICCMSGCLCEDYDKKEAKKEENGTGTGKG